MALLPALMTEIVIPVCVVIGIAFSLVQWRQGLHDRDNRIDEQQSLTATKQGSEAQYAETKKDVSEGVESFLFTEYQYVGVFVVAFAILIFLFLGSVESFSTPSRPCTFDPPNTCKPALATAVFSTVSFLLGALTSVLSGFLCTRIAIYASARTDLEAEKFDGRTFIATFRSGALMGFLLAAMGLLMLYLAINLFKLYYSNDWEGLFEAITGYGLGGSSMAFFGRVGGGIFAKAADVGKVVVEKIVANPVQDFRNPAVIPNTVGGVVGDIAGMGTDLFGSYAESSCAALVVASISSFGIFHDFTAMCYPLLINSMGILVCLITTLFTADLFRIKRVEDIEPVLKKQLLISTILMTVGIAIVSWIALPSSFAIYNFGSQKVVKNWQLFFSVGVGLWARQISGFVLECYTDNSYCLVQDGDRSLGLAAVIIPIFAIAISIFFSFSFAATYGIAVAAIGMLSTIATGLAIDAYGPISHNARGIAKTAYVSDEDHEKINALDATAAIGKEFAIGSAALVSLALFGAFVNRAAISPVDVLTPKFAIGLIMGAVLPYGIYAMTMKIVGSAGLKMAEQVLQQDMSDLQRGWEEPDYAKCIRILTDAAIRGVIPLGALVMVIPLIVGTFFGVETLSGVLAGSLVSVVWIATSASSTGGAWDKAKKCIGAGALEHVSTLPEESRLRRTLPDWEDGIGNLQDTSSSGAPLNILIQLMAVESLVFAPFFATYGGLLFKIF